MASGKVDSVTLFPVTNSSNCSVVVYRIGNLYIASGSATISVANWGTARICTFNETGHHFEDFKFMTPVTSEGGALNGKARVELDSTGILVRNWGGNGNMSGTLQFLLPFVETGTGS